MFATQLRARIAGREHDALTAWLSAGITWCRYGSQSKTLLVTLRALMHPPMKTMVGAKSSATLKSSRTNLGPSPRYFCMSSEPTTRRKVAEVLLATALANRVFPVPGSPYRITPWGRGRGKISQKSAN